MAAFLIADVKPDDLEAYRASGYLEAAVETAGRHGGVYRARGGRTEVLEGDWQPNRLVVIEFPDMDSLLAWYRDPEYQRWAAVRQGLSESRLVAIEGVTGQPPA